jgi:hypothetical protein
VLVLACRYHANISVPNKLVQDSATLEWLKNWQWFVKETS